MHLTALVESPTHVCCRYRVTALRPFLEAAGHTLELRALPRRWWTRVQLFRELEGTDALILQRHLLPRWQLYLLRRAVPSLIFDCDDAVFLRDSYSSGGLQSYRRRRRFAAVARAADAVMVGNTFLSVQATRWTEPERVHVVPTCVEPARYPLAAQQRVNAGVEMVWVGSSSTLQGLELVRPLLEEIGQRVPAVRLKLICDRFLPLDRLAVTNCDWAEETEATDIAAADIGISWLPDDSWSRGKCGLKVLQYMAAGLPVVANPVGVQTEMVRHGETGFLAETADQWVRALQRLAEDAELRQRMGRAARLRVEADYQVPVAARTWLTVLDELQERRLAAA